MLTVMGIYARSRGIKLEGSRAIVEKDMTKAPPRRIAELSVRLQLPAALTDKQREALRQVAETCPVAASLHPDVQVGIVFEFV